MKKGLFRYGAMIAIVLGATGFASSHNHELCSGFVPENTMKIPVGASHRMSFENDVPAAGITEAQFNAVIDRAERLFTADISKAGGTLKVNRKWTDATVNASASQSGTTWIVNMYGGLARHPAITVEGFALVICHEIGHHIGGAPKIKDWWGGVSWATNEGGADYYSTLKCLRRYFAEDDNEAITAGVTLDPLAVANCKKQFSTRADELLCLRNSMAGTSVALLFMDLRKEKTSPNFGTPDPAVVKQMDDNHPGTQCRLDTYFNGATCHVDASIPNSNTDLAQGACVSPQDTLGYRPLCWFKP